MLSRDHKSWTEEKYVRVVERIGQILPGVGKQISEDLYYLLGDVEGRQLRRYM